MMCRSLFVDLYQAMHDNLGGIILLEIDDYVKVIRVLLSFSLEISQGHQIQPQNNDVIEESKVSIFDVLDQAEEDFEEDEMSEADDSLSIQALLR